MEFLTSQRGKPVLCHEGYSYEQGRTSKNNVVSWRCQKRKTMSCPSTAQTFQGAFKMVKKHNHAVYPEIIAAAKLRCEMKMKAQLTDSHPALIFNDIIRSADSSVHSYLQSEETCKRTIRNIRSKRYPKQPKDLDSLAITGMQIITLIVIQNNRIMMY